MDRLPHRFGQLKRALCGYYLSGLGMKWVDAGPSRPARGAEITNQKLAEALAAKTEFSAEELVALGVSMRVLQVHTAPLQVGLPYMGHVVDRGGVSMRVPQVHSTDEHDPTSTGIEKGWLQSEDFVKADGR